MRKFLYTDYKIYGKLFYRNHPLIRQAKILTGFNQLTSYLTTKTKLYISIARPVNNSYVIKVNIKLEVLLLHKQTEL